MFEARPEALEVSASEGEGEISGTRSRSRNRQTREKKGCFELFFGANFQIRGVLTNMQEPVMA